MVAFAEERDCVPRFPLTEEVAGKLASHNSSDGLFPQGKWAFASETDKKFFPKRSANGYFSVSFFVLRFSSKFIDNYRLLG